VSVVYSDHACKKCVRARTHTHTVCVCVCVCVCHGMCLCLCMLVRSLPSKLHLPAQFSASSTLKPSLVRVSNKTMHVRAWFLLCVLATTLLGAGVVQADAGQGYEPGLEDEGDWADDMGYQSDPAYEQYAERLQQQLESLRKEHDEIFGRADVDKVRVMVCQTLWCVLRGTGADRLTCGSLATARRRVA